MATIILRTTNDLEQIHDRLDGMQERCDKFRPIFEGMREELQDAWKKNFLTNGSLVGGWAPLDKEYGAWKSVHFPGAPPMVRTGRLFTSLSDLRGPANEIRDQHASFGVEGDVAKFHQYGTTKMPKREIIFEPAGFAKRWGEKVVEYIINGSKDGNASS